jgi:hypothetical protein
MFALKMYFPLAKIRVPIVSAAFLMQIGEKVGNFAVSRYLTDQLVSNTDNVSADSLSLVDEFDLII